MCGVGFGGTAPELAVLLGACVIFSPVLLLWGVGYLGMMAAKATVSLIATAHDSNVKSIETTKRKIRKYKMEKKMKEWKQNIIAKIGQENVDKQIADLTNFIQEKPADADLYLQRAVCNYVKDVLPELILQDLDWCIVLQQRYGAPDNERPLPYHMRGIVYNKLKKYTEAIESFQKAILFNEGEVCRMYYQTCGEKPKLRTSDCYNQMGLSHLWSYLYGHHYVDNPSASTCDTQLLQQAIECFTQSITRSEDKGADKGLYLFHRGMANYYLHVAYEEEEGAESPKVFEQLKLTIADFEEAIELQFCSAELFSMKAQAHALLGDEEAAERDRKLAIDIDPKIVIVLDKSEMKHPWPEAKELQGEAEHEFKEVHFNRPTWCDHCTKFVVSPFGKQGFRCTGCAYSIHKECRSLVGSNCPKSIGFKE